MENINLINHPLAQDKLSSLRSKETSSKEFREYLEELSVLIAYEVFKDLKLKEEEIETPLSKTKGKKINEEINLFPILRAGQGFVSGFLNVVPKARVGHIGLYRDEKTLKPVQYLFKYPKNKNKEKTYNLLLDPIIATGGSIRAALKILNSIELKNIKVVAIISVKETIEKLAKDYPDVNFYLIAIDGKLDKKGYIIPGLGDAGDRIYGTK